MTLSRIVRALLSRAAHFVLGPLPLGDVPEHEDGPDQRAAGVPDGGGAVVDGPLGPVPRDQERVVRQPDDHPLGQRPQRGVLDRPAGGFVHNAEHVGQGPPPCLGRRPPGQRLGHRVQERHPPGGVGGDHRVADAFEGDAEPLPLGPQPRVLFSQFPLELAPLQPADAFGLPPHLFGLLVQVHEPGHLRADDGRHHRLGDEVHRAEGVGPLDLGAVGVEGGDEDDRRVPRGVAGANQSRRLEPVEAGHVDVEEDHRELTLAQSVQSLLAGPGLDEIGTEAVEDGAEGEQVGRLVVYQEDAGGRLRGRVVGVLMVQGVRHVLSSEGRTAAQGGSWGRPARGRGAILRTNREGRRTGRPASVAVGSEERNRPHPGVSRSLDSPLSGCSNIPLAAVAPAPNRPTSTGHARVPRAPF